VAAAPKKLLKALAVVPVAAVAQVVAAVVVVQQQQLQQQPLLPQQLQQQQPLLRQLPPQQQLHVMVVTAQWQSILTNKAPPNTPLLHQGGPTSIHTTKTASGLLLFHLARLHSLSKASTWNGQVIVRKRIICLSDRFWPIQIPTFVGIQYLKEHNSNPKISKWQ